jgi:Lipoprotein LpqB beta-propeller domain
VVAFRLARDGARAAVVLTEGGVGRLYLARVERFGEQPRIGELRRVESALVDVRDVVWRDAVRLAVLARDARGTVEPFVIDADSTAVSAAGSLDGVGGIAAAPGRPLLAVTADGKLWADRGFGWRQEGTGSDVSYPG